MMNRYLSLAYLYVALLSFSACSKQSLDEKKEYNPNKAVVLTSFYPLEGGARDKILLDGENFGTDINKIKVYFNNKRATIISSSGNRLYGIVPRLPGANPKISVVIGTIL